MCVMRRNVFFFSFVFSTAILGAEPETSINQINWGINIAPPFHIADGEYAQKGLCDVLVDTVHRYLPELKKRRNIMPHPRISMALERSEHLCFPCVIAKKQGERGAFYSQATHVYTAHKIITNQKTANNLKQQYGLPVPLTLLLKDKDLTFGYPAGRRYGVLQPIIEGQRNMADNLLVRAGENGPLAILQMITSQRLDYTVDYSIVKRYHQLTSGVQLHLLPIAENNSQPVMGAIACSNSDWGRSVIQKINHVMPQIHRDEAFQSSLAFWFEDDEAQTYRLFNQKHLAETHPD